MDVNFACIAGAEIHRQYDAEQIIGQHVGSRPTPFGQSGEMFLVNGDCPFYVLPRYGVGMRKVAPRKINARANMYALKDLGVQCVLTWSPGGAVTHTLAVGELVICSDLIDQTYLRDKTFFEDSPLGFLRQFPVFCPSLRQAAAEIISEMNLPHRDGGTIVASEGPRLETPAEVRLLAHHGAEVVTHAFVPEVFLAKELEMCYAGICYIVNYAESGSRHTPFMAGNLFGGLTQEDDAFRLSKAIGAMKDVLARIACVLTEKDMTCQCDKTMAANVAEYELSEDWRQWFDQPDQ